VLPEGCLLLFSAHMQGRP